MSLSDRLHHTSATAAGKAEIRRYALVDVRADSKATPSSLAKPAVRSLYKPNILLINVMAVPVPNPFAEPQQLAF